jgi:hypothetical protein
MPSSQSTFLLPKAQLHLTRANEIFPCCVYLISGETMIEDGASLKKALNKHRLLVNQVKEATEEIGRALENLLKDILPDIFARAGWEENGPETLCIFAPSHSLEKFLGKRIGEDGLVSLDGLLREEIPEIYNVECPFGVYLDKEEAEEVRARLRKLRVEIGLPV